MVADLIQLISELSKIYFTRTSGIDPLFSKQIVLTLTDVIKRSDEQVSQLAAMKALGIFASEACMVPSRCSFFFREVLEY